MKKAKQILSTFLIVLMLVTSVQLGGFSGIFSPIVAEAASNTIYKVTLTWSDLPKDLDSHLRGKDSLGEDFHIYYSDSSVYDVDGSLLAYLDVDDTDGYGPENVTIFRPIKGVTYSYFVYNYSDDARIAGCDAHVKVYKNDELLKEWTAPRTNSDGRYWNIFQIKDGKFIERNRIEESETFSEATDVKKIFGNSNDYYRKNVTFNNSGKNAYVTFKKDWFDNAITSNDTYNHELAQFCSLYSMFGYSSPYIKSCLDEVGFKLLDSNMSTARDEVNYFIAAKTVYYGTDRKNILFIGTIGSHKEQWYSNFDPYGYGRKNGKGIEKGKHCGFTDAMNFVKSKINSIFTDGKYGLDKENTILLFTGHSRGAATANLLAACARDEVKWAHSDSIYAYTFATPNNTPDANYNAQKYKFIHNIVNPEDMVTHVMLRQAWGYHKYGKVYVLPSKTNTSSKTYKNYLESMNYYYKQYKGDEYEPYPQGEKATYKIIERFNNNVKNISDLYNKSFIYVTFPKKTQSLTPYDFFQKTLLPYVAGIDKDTAQSNMFDVLLYSPVNGLYFKIISYFANPDIDFSIGNGAELGLGGRFEQAHTMETYCAYMQTLSSSTVTSSKSSKYGEWNCPVDIEIYDNETNELVGRIVNNVVDEEIAAKENSVVMDVEGDTKSYYLPSDGDYTVKIIGNDDGTADYTLTTLDSDSNEIERVNYFDIDVSNDSQMTSVIENDTTIADIELLDENDDIVDANEYFEISDDAKREVTVDVEGSGFVTGDGEAKSGDYVELIAISQCSSFLGWYKNNELISSEETYKFRVTDDIEFTAKFTEGNHTFNVEVTEPSCANKGNTANVCENCGLTEIISETDALGHDYVDHSAQNQTCEEIGWVAYQTCSRCNYSTYVELPAYGHNFTIQADYSNVSDNGDGTHSVYCVNCNIKGETENHTFEDGTHTAPTCTEDGFITYLCSYCDAESVIIEEGTATGHNYVNGHCTVCGERDPNYVYPKISVNKTKTVNIEYGGDIFYFEFTPTVDGKYVFYSNGDYDTYGYLYDENINQLTQDDDGGCDNNFLISYNFEKGKKYIFGCGMYSSNTIGTFNVTLEFDKEEHTHNYKLFVTAPTCTQKGYTTYTCECGDNYVDDYVNATGHSYDSGKVTKAATCSQTGVKIYTCTDCGETKTEAIPKTAHTYETTTTKATTNKNGSIVTKCSVCGDINSSTVIYYPKTITLSAVSYTYNGKAKKPGVTVTDSNGNEISASNYTVAYSSGCKNVGTYTVTIKFKGNYSGTVKKTFTIKPKATSISKLTAKSKGFTVKWKKLTTQTTGYQIQYSTSSKFTNAKTVTVSKNKTVSKTISKLKANKKYYVRVRAYKTVSVNGVYAKIYSSWSKAKSVTTKNKI